MRVGWARFNGAGAAFRMSLLLLGLNLPFSSIGVAFVTATLGPADGGVKGGEMGAFGLASGFDDAGTGKLAMLFSNSV